MDGEYRLREYVILTCEVCGHRLEDWNELGVGMNAYKMVRHARTH